MFATDNSKSLSRNWTLSGLASLVIAVIGVSLVVYFFDPSHHSFYPRCLFHQLTGLYCPGCGSLRALHQLLHGQFVAAVHFNALLILTLLLVIWIVARHVLAGFGLTPFRFQAHLLWIALAIGLLFSILRNLPFARAWLAP